MSQLIGVVAAIATFCAWGLSISLCLGILHARLPFLLRPLKLLAGAVLVVLAVYAATAAGVGL